MTCGFELQPKLNVGIKGTLFCLFRVYVLAFCLFFIFGFGCRSTSTTQRLPDSSWTRSLRKGITAMAGVRDIRDGLILDGMAPWHNKGHGPNFKLALVAPV